MFNSNCVGSPRLLPFNSKYLTFETPSLLIMVIVLVCLKKRISRDKKYEMLIFRLTNPLKHKLKKKHDEKTTRNNDTFSARSHLSNYENVECFLCHVNRNQLLGISLGWCRCFLHWNVLEIVCNTKKIHFVICPNVLCKQIAPTTKSIFIFSLFFFFLLHLSQLICIDTSN